MESIRPTVVASSTYIGPGPLPKYWAGRDPTMARFEGEHLVQLILTKVVFTCKGCGGDAALGSMVTFVLSSCFSWSRCTDMETFA